jgi:pyrroloquinoline-quinone synthase
MTVKEKLAAVVARRALLEHPFYQAWNQGTLPAEALQAYAREYGAFIASLEQGWQTLGDAETAAEEKEHAELWDDFAAALGTSVAEPRLEQTRLLVAAADELFSSPATALGAMYAFEVQQPETAHSKLDGLRQHYPLPESAQRYFEVHSTNWHESEKILAGIASLPAGEQDQALEACERMGEALWDALTGIYETHCVH